MTTSKQMEDDLKINEKNGRQHKKKMKKKEDDLKKMKNGRRPNFFL